MNQESKMFRFYRRIYEVVIQPHGMDAANCVIVCMLTAIAGLIGIFTEFLSGTSPHAVLTFIFVSSGAAYLQRAAWRTGKYKQASLLLAIVMCNVLFPSFFFMYGGFYSGMPVWMLVSVCVLTILSPQSQQQKMALSVHGTLTVIQYFFLFYYVANHPDVFPAVYTKEEMFLDMAMASLLGGFMLSAYIQLQRFLYDMQLEQIRVASNYKSVFLSNMSHEMRTPLNTIMGMTEILSGMEDDPTKQEYLQDIRMASELLLSLIGDVLDMTRIESGRVLITEVEYSLADLIHTLQMIFTDRMERKGLQFIVEYEDDTPNLLYGDRDHLLQILVNLISNAEKYTKEGSVTLRVAGREPLRFSVKDTGIGIKEEDKERIFARFERGNTSAGKEIQGLGLGLSIVTGLLSEMGSRIQVDSVEGKGSEFSFELDQKIIGTATLKEKASRIRFEVPEKKEPVKTEESKKRIKPERVLVVDDNALNRKVFTRFMQQMEIPADQAESGKQCLQMIAETHYDYIFLDHMMPEMDGLEVIARMQTGEAGECADSVVIALTANAVLGAEEMYLKAGFDGYLSKPFKIADLERIFLA